MSYANYHSRQAPAFLGYLAALLRYRHLCWNLVGSDLRSRFRRSYLGILWAVIQPLGYSLVIAWAWGTLFGSQSFWSFCIYVFSGMLVWEYFQNTINISLETLLNSSGYLRQARIPLFIFQLRVPMTGMVTLTTGLLGLMVLETVLGMMPPPGLHLLLIPAFLVILLAFMTPLAIIFSVLGAQLRDLKHIMGLILQALFFLSPVMMARNVIDMPHLAVLNFINPLVSLLDLLRDPLLHGLYWKQQTLITVSIWGAALWALAGVLAAQAGRKLVFSI
jgi:lipopolysaccharide transport system permease protein